MSLQSIEDLILGGHGRSAIVGAFSTGGAGGGAAAIIDLDRPNLAIGVPAGFAIRPFHISAQVQPGAATTDADEAEILFAVDSLGLWRGTGTSTVVTPSNLRTDLDKGSACRVGATFSADMTTTPGFAVEAAADPVLDLELAREVQTLELATAANQNLYLVRLNYEPDYPPFLVGPCTLFVYYGGTVALVGGFAQVQWVEGTLAEIVPAI